MYYSRPSSSSVGWSVFDWRLSGRHTHGSVTQEVLWCFCPIVCFTILPTYEKMIMSMMWFFVLRDSCDGLGPSAAIIGTVAFSSCSSSLVTLLGLLQLWCHILSLKLKAIRLKSLITGTPETVDMGWRGWVHWMFSQLLENTEKSIF